MGRKFNLTKDQWDNFQAGIQSLGIKMIPSSKQYLEDCDSGVTDLIAIIGILEWEGSDFEFTAQLDFSGYALYIDETDDATRYKEFISYLEKYYALEKDA